MLDDAKLLESQGRRAEALMLLSRAKERLITAIAFSRTKKANFSWQLAIIAMALFVSGMWFRFDQLKRVEKGEGPHGISKLLER